MQRWAVQAKPESEGKAGELGTPGSEDSGPYQNPDLGKYSASETTGKVSTILRTKSNFSLWPTAKYRS